MSVGDGGEALEAVVAEHVQGPDAELPVAGPERTAWRASTSANSPMSALGVAAWEGVPGAAAVGDGARGPVLAQQAGDLRS